MNEHRVSQLIDEARYYVDHAMWLHAVQSYRQLIDAFPAESRFYLDLATIYMEMGNLDAAEQTLIQALSRDSQNPDILFALGIAFYRAGKFEKALPYLEQLIGRRLPKVHQIIGLIYHQRGDLHSAERQFRLTLEYDPEYPLARISLAKVLLQLHEAARALPILDSELLRHPDSAEVQVLKGLAHAMAAEWPAAITAFEELLRKEPENTSALLGAANAWIQMKKPDKAGPLLLRAQEVAPESPEVQVHLGLLAMLRSDRTKAAIHFSRALEFEPENHDALQHLRLLRANDTTAS